MGVKKQECEADFLPFSAGVKNSWSYSSLVSSGEVKNSMSCTTVDIPDGASTNRHVGNFTFCPVNRNGTGLAGHRLAGLQYLIYVTPK